MFNCKEITEQSDGYMTGDLGFYRKLQIRLHLMMCRHCRRYVRQANLLIKALHRLYGPSSNGEVNGVMRAIRNGLNNRGDTERQGN